MVVNKSTENRKAWLGLAALVALVLAATLGMDVLWERPPARLADSRVLRGHVRDVRYRAATLGNVGGIRIELDVEGASVTLEQRPGAPIERLSKELHVGDVIDAWTTNSGVWWARDKLLAVWQIQRGEQMLLAYETSKALGG